MTHLDDDHDTTPSWSQRPRPVGSEITYRIEGDELHVLSVRKTYRVKLKSIIEIRFSVDAGTVMGRNHKIRLTFANRQRLTFGNVSWRSLMDIERDDPRYGIFVEKLCKAVAAANPNCRFLAGKPWLIWVAFTALTAAALVGMAAFAWLAFSRGQHQAMGISLFLLVVMLWQMQPLVRLNQPKVLATGEVPAWLMP
ncbi:MAG: hypothetical protein ACRC56_09190 [Bosea sp. (in: a-proteobacteria)]